MTSRKAAVDRGLRFIFEHSLAGENFDDWAGDYLWCFLCISRTAIDPELRLSAREMGAQSAKRWYAQETGLPALADAGEAAYYISLMDVASRLGVDDEGLRGHVRQRYREFTSRDYLGFDPAREAPPALGQRSRYEVWCDALVLTYTADGFGMPLPASYADVARWAPAMRPYPNPAAPGATEFPDVVYAITHLVYTLNDYNRHRLLPEWLPQEFEYLRAHLKRPLQAGDPELLGEFVDCLRAFGLPDTDPGIAAGIDYLLRTQNADGSWGDAGYADGYHTTWTAIDALRDYQWAELAEVPGAVRRMLAVSCDAFQLGQ
jgi:hypothetical protein